MRRTLSSTALLAPMAIAILLIPTAALALSIGFDPTSQDVPLGNPAMVDILISDLADFSPPSLGEFDLTVSFDPTIIAFDSLTFGDPVLGDQLDLLALGSITDVFDGAPGEVSLFELSLDPSLVLDTMQAGSFVLASLTFDTLSAGTSDLLFDYVLLGDADGNSLSSNIGVGSITVTTGPPPVPEPGTILLLGSGLLGLVGLRKKIRD